MLFNPVSLTTAYRTKATEKHPPRPVAVVDVRTPTQPNRNGVTFPIVTGYLHDATWPTLWNGETGECLNAIGDPVGELVERHVPAALRYFVFEGGYLSKSTETESLLITPPLMMSRSEVPNGAIAVLTVEVQYMDDKFVTFTDLKPLP